MDNIGLCRQFEKEPTNLLLANEDVVWPFDERTKTKLFSYRTCNRNRCRHGDHENMVDGNFWF
jgi:hypothetical protein